MFIFKLSIIAPSGKIFEDNVDAIAVHGVDGDFEVYSRHTPLIASLKAGRIRVRHSHRETSLDMTGGILEVDIDHNVTLLADQAFVVQ